MTVMIRCRCGHQASAVSFITMTHWRDEKRPGEKLRVRVDTTPPNVWRCPSCKVTFQVTKDGIKLVQSTFETQEQMRERLRKAWGLDAA